MQIQSTITISVKDIHKWISQSNSLHSLQSLRAKTNKRIKYITQGREESPFRNIPIEEKRKILEPLFIGTETLLWVWLLQENKVV